jgi:hypothetical protein
MVVKQISYNLIMNYELRWFVLKNALIGYYRGLMDSSLPLGVLSAQALQVLKSN